MWTEARVEEWRRMDVRPAVAVWNVEHLATFRTATVDDSLFALWWLIGLRRLRHGEACGLRWTDIDLDHRLRFIVRNRMTAGYRVVEGPPGPAAGTRAISLDKHTVKILETARLVETYKKRRPAANARRRRRHFISRCRFAARLLPTGTAR